MSHNAAQALAEGSGSALLKTDSSSRALVAGLKERDLGQVDSKKELEKLLKAACEAFIMRVTKATVEPMLSFITKVTAVRALARPITQHSVSAPQPPAPKPLREQVIHDGLTDSRL